MGRFAAVAYGRLWHRTLSARFIAPCVPTKTTQLPSDSLMGFKLLLLAGACFVAFTSAVTLAEELVEWRRRRALHGELLPPAS